MSTAVCASREVWLCARRCDFSSQGASEIEKSIRHSTCLSLASASQLSPHGIDIKFPVVSAISHLGPTSDDRCSAVLLNYTQPLQFTALERRDSSSLCSQRPVRTRQVRFYCQARRNTLSSSLSPSLNHARTQHRTSIQSRVGSVTPFRRVATLFDHYRFTRSATFSIYPRGQT